MSEKAKSAKGNQRGGSKVVGALAAPADPIMTADVSVMTEAQGTAGRRSRERAPKRERAKSGEEDAEEAARASESRADGGGSKAPITADTVPGDTRDEKERNDGSGRRVRARSGAEKESDARRGRSNSSLPDSLADAATRPLTTGLGAEKGDDSKIGHHGDHNPFVLPPRRRAVGSTSSTSASSSSSSSSSSSTTTSSSSSASAVSKRADYLSWDDYFLSVAFLSAMRSKDPSTQVGACLVDDHQRIVGIGYNGMPRGCSDDVLPWARTAADPLDTKYPYVCHAEMNAILNKNAATLEGCRLYVALFPCNECAKLVIQSGIREVVFFSDKYHDAPAFVASRRLFDMAGVRYRQHTPAKTSVELRFEE